MQVYNQTVINDEPRPARDERQQAAHLVKDQLAGVSRWAAEARSAILTHAAHDNSVLLEGEPGSGKERIARLIHRSSARRDGPFIAISCNYVSTESLEAALFGVARWLPSGSTYTSRGVVESAEGGTLYINGAATLAPPLQEKIARLIKYREFRRPQGEMFEYVDARVIIGSPQPHTGARGAGESTLSVSDRLVIPPLRQRTDDIDPLSRCFITELCAQLGKEKREISPETLAMLCRYEWPGNVAELKGVIHHMIQQSRPCHMDASLLPAHIINSLIPGGVTFPESGLDLAEEVKNYEVALLCAALKRAHGVQYKAASLLGIKPTTFNTKIMRYGIDVTAFKP